MNNNDTHEDLVINADPEFTDTDPEAVDIAPEATDTITETSDTPPDTADTDHETENDSSDISSETVSDEISAIDKWIEQDEKYRKGEIDFLSRVDPDNECVVLESGILRKAITIDDFIFLLEIDSCFPQYTSNKSLPINIYLVVPQLNDLKIKLGTNSIENIVEGDNGVHLVFDDINKEYANYLKMQHEQSITELLHLHTRKWVDMISKKIEEVKRDVSEIQQSRRNPFSNTQLVRPRNTRKKYTEGKLSQSDKPNPKCHKIVLSDRAFIQIYNETSSRITTETGGLLLGHFDNNVWYVVEASDPGINAKFFNAYHEGDDVYENHICGVISRIYKHPLVFLGMWHRHPGSLDMFSLTDDNTNAKYATSAGNGCISAIINVDPNFRITFYYVEKDQNNKVYYTKVDVEVGNDKFPNKEILKIATAEDVDKRR